MDGQEIFGGQFNYVILEKSQELIGDSCSISLSQEANSTAIWTIDVEVHLAQGKFRLGTFVTLSPASGQPASRAVAVATYPGAIGWSVICHTSTAGEIAGLTLDSSKCCNSATGVEEIVQTPIPGSGVTILGPFPLPTLEADRPWTNNFSTALANSFIIKAIPGILRNMSLRIDATLPTGVYYLQLWNLVAPPADTTAVTILNSLDAPVKVTHVLGVDDLITYDFSEYGIPFVGASLNISSTEFTKTTVAGSFVSLIGAELR